MATKTGDFKRHFEQFSKNVSFAARVWHRHVHLKERAEKDTAILAALNRAAHYWLDQRYIAVQTTIIFLGKIFDPARRAHNVDKTIKAATDETDYFSQLNLRKRKVELGGEFEGIDEYIQNAHELDSTDLHKINVELQRSKSIWEGIKPIRNKIYAHNEMLSDVEHERLFEAVNEDDITKVIQIVLNISNALWQAEFNGHKPDFSSNHTQPIEWAKKDVEELIGSLLGQ